MDFDETWYIISPWESLKPVDFQWHRSQVKVAGSNFYMQHPCEHSRINVFQWMFTKLGMYLVVMKFRNPLDFEGHRSKVKVTGSIFRRGYTPRFVLFVFILGTISMCSLRARKR